MSSEQSVDQVVDRALVRDLAKRLLRETAPEELPLLRPASERYFADPEKALRERREQQEVLGFGAEAAIALLTPVVLSVATDVLTELAKEIGKLAGSKGVNAIRAALRRLFRLDPSSEEAAPVEIPPITREQLIMVRQNAFDRAMMLDLPEEKAGLLADAVVGSLAIVESQSHP